MKQAALAALGVIALAFGLASTPSVSSGLSGPCPDSGSDGAPRLLLDRVPYGLVEMHPDVAR